MRQRLKRGDTVWWWSLDRRKATTAVFVEYDPDLPAQYCILAIGIGVKGNRMTHSFRWPLDQVANNAAPHTMTTTTKRKGT